MSAAVSTDPFDEFSFLPAQAAELGLDTPLPRGERLTLALPDGRSLSALRYGEGAPVVTFLHGAGLNAHTWDMTVLTLGLPALAIDLAGHGDSTWRDDADYTGRTLAADVALGIDAWTDAPQVLVGQSLGGLTATAVAAAHPELVKELVIVDITPGIDRNHGPSEIRAFFSGPTDWASRDELVERALSFGFGGSRSQAERGVFLNSRVRPDGRVEWKHHFSRLAAIAIPEDGADTRTAVLSEHGWEDLAAVRAPITLVRGDQGYVSEQAAADFAARVPQASVTTLPAGHNVQENAPVQLAALARALV